MNKKHIVLFFLLAATVAVAQTKYYVPDSLLHRQIDLSMLERQSRPWTEGCDSIYITYLEKYFYYHSDSLFHLIATRPLEEVYEEVWYYYDLLPNPYTSKDSLSDVSRWQFEREKLAKAAKRYKSKALERELDVFDVHYNLKGKVTPAIWDKYWKLVKKYEQKKEYITKLRILNIMLTYWSGFGGWALSTRIEKEHVPAIQVINEILSTLKQVEGRSNIGCDMYFQIGHIYYNFELFDKAIPLFWKRLEYPHCYYQDRSLMRARNYMAICCREKGDYDRSDSLNLSMLLCSDSVFQRPIDETVAIGGLAGNAARRGEHEEALRLYTIVLQRALQVKDVTLAGGYAVRLGRLFLQNNEPQKTEEWLQTARNYLNEGGDRIRNRKAFYTLGRDYYLKINQADKAAAYIDSLSSIQTLNDETHNAGLLAYAEQEAFEYEKALKDNHIMMQNNRLRFISVILALALTVLGLMIYFYRTKQKKNRALFRQIKEKDQLIQQMDILLQQHPAPIEQKYEHGNTKQQLLFDKFHAYLLQDKNFTNPDIDYIQIAAALTTNKTYLYEAVKVVSGKSPIEYINGLRVDETRKMLESRSNYSIMVIASECGFNSYRTFQRLFRKTYRLSPVEYSKLTRTEQTV